MQELNVLFAIPGGIRLIGIHLSASSKTYYPGASHSGEPKAEWDPGEGYYDLAGPDTYGRGTQARLFTAVQAIHGATMPIPYHECGTIPDPDACFAERTTWSWWMVLHTSHLSNHDKDALIKAYTSDLVITRDEVGDIMEYLE